MAILFIYPGFEALGEKLIKQTGFISGDLVIHQFPDKESMVQIKTDVKGQEIYILCSLDRPDKKAMALMFFAQSAKEFGAKKVGLIAPYLGYMRQDIRFQEGEAITSKIFAEFLSGHFDSLVTIDPHLHRYKSLDQIYTIPSKLLHASHLIADWIRANVKQPLLIGPDEESEQWVSGIAAKAQSDYIVLKKTRYGDREVQVTAPNVENYKHHTPVLVDDIVSTAKTMIKAVEHLNASGMRPPICIGIHAIFADESYQELKDAGVEKIVTCNTVVHPSNEIDLSELLAGAIL